MLRDDPAAKWLSPWSRLQAAAAGLALPAIAIVIAGVALMEGGIAEASRRTPASTEQTRYLIAFGVLVLLAFLAPTLYWVSLQLRSRAILALVWKGVVAEALALDD